MLQSQLREAKLLWPRSPHVRLLERRYQTRLRHSRSKFAQREIADFSQLLRTNPCKFWQAARLPNMMLPRQLHDPAAWDSFVSKLTAPPTQHATQLPAPHTPQPPAAAHSLSPWLRLRLGCNICTVADPRPCTATLQSCYAWLRYDQLVATPDDPAPAHLLAPCLVVLFNAAFSTGQVPHSWKTSLVIPVFKRGDAIDTANHRPISVGEPISRLYVSIMVHRPCHMYRAATAATCHPDRLPARGWHHPSCLRPSACC
ncbi:TPA: hypothetical protein ACH3X1_002826 [Trebouxia sp. C0004]